MLSYLSPARKVKDNLTQDERNCLKDMSKWDKDENCNRMFRVQDKESRLVSESKERYKRLMLQYLEEKVYLEKTTKIKTCLTLPVPGGRGGG